MIPPMHSLRTWMVRLVEGIRSGDEAGIARAVEDLSRSRRYLAPLALAVGGIAMLLGGVRLLFSNWRLTLIQVLPAVWIWLAMYDLRAHLLHDREFRDWEGVLLALLILLIAAITVVVFFFNAVFGFAINQEGTTDWAAGNIGLGNGTVFNNDGSFLISADEGTIAGALTEEFNKLLEK